MTSDQFDNKENNGKVREITQDRRNDSSKTGRKQEPASLSFNFENRPEEPDGLDFDFENKPDDTQKSIKPVKAPAEKVQESVSKGTLAPEKSKKQYGLPENYSMQLSSKKILSLYEAFLHIIYKNFLQVFL